MPDINNVKTQVSSGAHTHTNNTNEHIIHEFLKFKNVANISLDLSLITLPLQIKVYEKVDEINYRILSFKTFNQGRFDISTVVDNSGEAGFTTTLPHDLNIGDTIIHREFTVGGYIGTFTVSAIPTGTTYELTGVNFNGTDTGYLVQNKTNNDFSFGQQTVTVNMEGISNDMKLTFQSPVAEGADRNVPTTLRVTIP